MRRSCLIEGSIPSSDFTCDPAACARWSADTIVLQLLAYKSAKTFSAVTIVYDFMALEVQGEVNLFEKEGQSGDEKKIVVLWRAGPR